MVYQKKLVLILGGARSGKSDYAERLARQSATRVLYVATASVGDEEMARRIDAHKRTRPAAWRTLEEPRALAHSISAASGDAELVIIDCITLWISNLLLTEGGEEADPDAEDLICAEIANLLRVYEQGTATFLIIANEVGLGLVPPYPLGRAYRDALGRTNQSLAAAADEVYFMVAGIPVPVKKP